MASLLMMLPMTTMALRLMVFLSVFFSTGNLDQTHISCAVALAFYICIGPGGVHWSGKRVGWGARVRETRGVVCTGQGNTWGGVGVG